MTTLPASLVFCALDTDDLSIAQNWAKEIGPVTGALKLGMEFYNRFGPAGVEAVREACPEAAMFIDLKFHDIPNTVAAAVRTVSSNLSPAYLNVHAAGGRTMMQAAKNACSAGTKLLAVTILTSLNDADLAEVGYQDGTAGQVKRMALLTHDSGLDGVVCSAHDIAALRASCGADFELMVPGIRPAGADAGDQKRIMTPVQAITQGATHIVVGRPITQSANPAQAAADIVESLAA